MTDKKKKGFDDIFAPTAPPKAAAAKRAAKPKAPAAAPAAPTPQPSAPAAVAAPGFAPDPQAVLQTLWVTHEHEALYRKGKEDRLMVFAVGLLVAVVFGAAFVLGAGRALDWHWLSRLIFRLFFVGVAFGVTFAANSLVELNRKRLQDVLAMIVKTQETMGLYADGVIPGADGAYIPNTYKFLGSINDDETSYAQMIMKVAAVAAAFTILLLV